MARSNRTLFTTGMNLVITGRHHAPNAIEGVRQSQRHTDDDPNRSRPIRQLLMQLLTPRLSDLGIWPPLYTSARSKSSMCLAGDAAPSSWIDPYRHSKVHTS